MGDTIIDPVFGQLQPTTRSDLKGKFNSILFGKEFEFTVEVQAPGTVELPDDSQRDEFLKYLESESDLQSVLTDALAERYLEDIAEIRSAWGFEADEMAPHLESNEQIWSLLSNPSLTFGIDDSGAWISWDARWDPEHGLTAFISEGKLVGFE